MPVIPSVKYHLPGPGETEWQLGEYVETTRALLEAWGQGGGALPMPLEKDFSPTLAGSDLAAARPTVLNWLRRVPELVRNAAAGCGQARSETVQQPGYGCIPARHAHRGASDLAGPTF